MLGDHHLTDKKLHDVYGPVVRIGPNTLSFSAVSAAQAIYGFNKSMTKGAFYACFGDPDPEKANMFQTRTAGKHHELRRKMVSGAVSRLLRDLQALADSALKACTKSYFDVRAHCDQDCEYFHGPIEPAMWKFEDDSQYGSSHPPVRNGHM